MRAQGLGLTMLFVAAGCTQTATIGQPGDDVTAVTGKGLTNAAGPDIGVNQARLQASIQVLNNQTISQQEVQDGCATGGGTTGRTLIRFDVETPNKGPGNLAVGSATCRSTDPSASCMNVDCNSAPDCCSGGRHVCTVTGNPALGRGFEYNSAHRHIHFRSFAQYRLLTATGTIAAQGHKQSFCLMDMVDSLGPGSCHPQFGCGNQGISAGCADVYSSSLPCGFVDVTGVPGGDYQLEVTMDPEDVINESNESNNRVLVNVRIPDNQNPPPPPPPSHQLFLVRDGVGDPVTAIGYYRTVLPGTDITTYTLEQWKRDQIGTRAVVTGLYRNRAELGFWREMTCTTQLGRGFGGCFVTNWNEVDDRQRGVPNLGTVAMTVSPEGFTRFYVFSPAGVLQPFAILDSEGEKFVPQLCTSCHSGAYQSTTGPDLGSVFREFEPAQFQVRPGITDAEAQTEWFGLNQAIRSANAAIHSEAQGAPFGTDHAKAAIATYLDEMYPTGAPPAIAIQDPGHVPASWTSGLTGPERDARIALWTKLTNVYCMTCHRTNSINFANYSEWSLLQAQSGGRALIRKYISVDPSDPDRTQLAFMPQSKVAFEILQNDAEALISIDNWLAAPSNGAPTVSASASPVNPKAGDEVSLHGTFVDGDGDPVTLQWEVATGPAVVFRPSSTAADVTFFAPPVMAVTEIVLRLRGNDGRGGIGQSTVAVTVHPYQSTGRVQVSGTPGLFIPDNTPAPVTTSLTVTDTRIVQDLTVGIDITHTYIGDLIVTLRSPTFSTVLHNRAGGGTHDLHLSVQVPEAVGARATGEWVLEVWDRAGADVGTVDAWRLDFGVEGDPEPSPNHAPEANAGADLTAPASTMVVLDGTASFDPDAESITFRWAQTSGAPVTLIGADTPRPSFVAGTAADTLELELTVTDARGLSAADRVRVGVLAPPAPTGQLVIAEVMVNPVGTDADHEWVKVLNASNQTVDLSRYSIAFAGDPTWGTQGGGILGLSGTLPPGKCLLVGGPIGNADNGNPSFTLGADYGLTQAVRFSGYGLQNPATNAPDAVALFELAPSAVKRESVPLDIVVYHATTLNRLTSPFRGTGTTTVAPVNIITSYDGANGRSFRRLRMNQWEVSGKVGGADGTAPTPNNCTALLP